MVDYSRRTDRAEIQSQINHIHADLVAQQNIRAVTVIKDDLVRVAIGKEIQQVIPRPALKRIGTRPRIQRIIARVAQHQIIAILAIMIFPVLIIVIPFF